MINHNLKTTFKTAPKQCLNQFYGINDLNNWGNSNNLQNWKIYNYTNQERCAYLNNLPHIPKIWLKTKKRALKWLEFILNTEEELITTIDSLYILQKIISTIKNDELKNNLMILQELCVPTFEETTFPKRIDYLLMYNKKILIIECKEYIYDLFEIEDLEPDYYKKRINYAYNELIEYQKLLSESHIAYYLQKLNPLLSNTIIEIGIYPILYSKKPPFEREEINADTIKKDAESIKEFFLKNNSKKFKSIFLKNNNNINQNEFLISTNTQQFIEPKAFEKIHEIFDNEVIIL